MLDPDISIKGDGESDQQVIFMVGHLSDVDESIFETDDTE